ncbi:MAG: iron-siderophore ABC transporter substrate-binding protein [Propionibacteriaceae bacterium]
MTGAFNRRTLLGSMLALAGGAALAGCSGSEPGQSTTPSPSSGEGAFPATIENTFGSTVVEAAPSKVYSLGFTDHDAFMALGVLPVAVTQWFPEFAIGPWATEARSALGGADPKVLKDTAGTNFEAVAAAAPDLISSYYSGIEKAEYDKLAALAPVLTRPAGSQPWSSTWDGQLAAIGKALGKSEDAAKLAADVNQQLTDTGSAHPEFKGKTCSLVLPGEAGEMYVYTDLDPRYRVLTALGFQLSPTVKSLPGVDKDFFVTISAEQVNKLDADVIGVLSNAADRAKLTSDKIWQKVPAVAAGRVAYLDLEKIGYALSFSTVLSIPFALTGVAEEFGKVIAA